MGNRNQNYAPYSNALENWLFVLRQKLIKLDAFTPYLREHRNGVITVIDLVLVLNSEDFYWIDDQLW